MVPVTQRISVIVPAFNSAQTIAAALKSAFSQEPGPLEVIVVDDGSRDDTPEVVARSFPQARLVRQSNQGPSAARNAAASMAQGEWLAFLDADDAWLQGKLRLQMEALSRAPETGMCSCDWVRDVASAPRTPSLSEIPIRRFGWQDIIRLNRFQTSTALVRRDLWHDAGGFRSSMDGTEDWDFWMRVSRQTVDLHLAWPLVVYRDEQASYSKNSRRVYDAMVRMLSEIGPPDGPIPDREFRRLLAWHDVRFAYAFWRQGRRQDLADALRHGLSRSSLLTLASVGVGEFLPYLLGRGARRTRR